MEKARSPDPFARNKIVLGVGATFLILALSYASVRLTFAFSERSLLQAHTEEYCAGYKDESCQNVLQRRSASADEMAVEVAFWQGLFGVLSIILLWITLTHGHRAAHAAADAANAAREANELQDKVSRHTVRAYLDLNEPSTSVRQDEKTLHLTLRNRGETAAERVKLTLIEIKHSLRKVTRRDVNSIRRHGTAEASLDLDEDFRFGDGARIDVIIEYYDIFDQRWRGKSKLFQKGEAAADGTLRLGLQDSGEEKI